MLDKLKRLTEKLRGGNRVVVVTANVDDVPTAIQCARNSIGLWNELPETWRNTCLCHLEETFTQWPHIVVRWQEQVDRGALIGSDDVRFHFGAGMAVRNILRQVLPDHKLPTGNWDDYYYGAIDAFARVRK
jgi:hypothetical protein